MEKNEKPEEVLEFLLKKDPKLIPYFKHKHVSLRDKPGNPFKEIVRIILSQMLSNTAAELIFQRVLSLQKLHLEFSPKVYLEIEPSDIRKCGVSQLKVNATRNIAEVCTRAPLYFSDLEDNSDNDIVDQLVDLKGVGNWTANIFLMSYYQRCDVFPAGDATLKKAVSHIYQIDIRANQRQFDEITNMWSPYRSYVSRCLWDAVDSGKIK